MPRLRPPLVLLAVAAAAGCGSTSDPDDDGGASARSTGVEIVDFTFAPDALSVAVGDTVTFTNRDDATHTATGSGASPIDSPDITTDESFAVTLDEAGTYEYLCKFHPFMTGSITVEG